jgi:hexosaminidase
MRLIELIYNFELNQQQTMTNFLKQIATLVFVCLCAHSWAQQISIIPEPAMLKRNEGVFSVTNNTLIVTGTQPEVTKIGNYLAAKLKPATGFDLKTGNSGSGIQLSLNKTANPQIGKEGYTLEVTPTQVAVNANTPAGLFYGVQTLLQLLPDEVESKALVSNVKWEVPAVLITDVPRFAWRGLMLDVSRHFFPKEYIKNYIDQMARFKFNRFHWHLTDDNGWRIEIKSFPKLTEVGAWRVPRVGTFNTNDPPKPNEKATDGGFYTQDDIREIIQYAKDRFVEILPEVDVPGHSMAALAAYPEYCVTRDTSLNVNPGSSFSTWFGNGKFTMQVDNTLNPTDENVYKFLDKVFGEIAGLFPYEYIHIGGDECYKGYWEKDANVQSFMKKNKIKDGEALQSYFTKRVADMIIAKKKKVIGWDEILEGGLAADAAVMSWRGTKGGIEASHLKHPVVMSPSPLYYLDMAQGERIIEPPIYGVARLKDTYAMDIIPEGADSTYILGGQGNLWTEQIPTTHQVEYMTYPRAFAMAESLWSPKSKKNWEQFAAKVENQFVRFDNANVNYATSMYDPIISVTKNTTGQLVVKLDTEIKGLTVHYTYDNTIPGKYSPAYNNEPVVIPDGADNFRVTTFRNGKPIGRLISFKMEDLAKKVK